MDIALIIDSCSDLSGEYIIENDINYLSLTYEINNVQRRDDLGKTMSYKEFYDSLRNGDLSKTSQINVYQFYEEFKRLIELNKSIIYIGFSSALSGCINSAQIARNQIMEEYKDADISVVDTKSASMGQGLLVYYANEMLKNGHSKEEIVDWLEKNKLKVNHWFTVEDLNHLKRGGRISATVAAVGTLLNIKPILIVNDEGKLISVDKVKGRKKSLRTLVEKLEERIVNPMEQVIAISHGDCIEDAEYVKVLIVEKYDVKDVIINNIGPVIGSHSGSGTIALFFLGNNR